MSREYMDSTLSSTAPALQAYPQPEAKSRLNKKRALARPS